MKAVVSEKGQLTIPKQLRERLGIRAGQTVEVLEEAGHLVVRKVSEQDSLERVYGILPATPSTDALLRAMRGDPDAT